MVIETALVFGLGWMLGKGSPFTKGPTVKTSATPPTGKGATKPSKVPWPSEGGAGLEPGTELPGVPWASASASPAEQASAVKDAEKYHANQQAHLDAQANEDYKRAGSDETARADIRRKYQARQKALDDYKREIARAKGGIANMPNG
jgi:hypothetical protein